MEVQRGSQLLETSHGKTWAELGLKTQLSCFKKMHGHINLSKHRKSIQVFGEALGIFS